MVNAELTWSAQRPLAARFKIVAPNRRGFPPEPEVDHVDFELPELELLAVTKRAEVKVDVSGFVEPEASASLIRELSIA